MAKLGWTPSIGLAVGAAAGAAAAQFGLGYGLGIIKWTPDPQVGTPNDRWLASLGWVTFVAATSTVIGAMVADRRSGGDPGAAPPRPRRGDGRPIPPGALTTAVWRTLLAFCAAIGGLLCAALVLVPARDAIRAGTTSPELIAVGYAIVGVIVGVVIAVCALSLRAAAINVLASAAWVWILAIAAVVDAQLAHRDANFAPLAVWPFGPGTYFHTTWSVAGTALMFGAAFLIGAGTAWLNRRSDSNVGVALSGAAGPLMVAAAYLLTAPHLVGVQANAQFSAYLTAPYAVVAGLCGSVLVVALIVNSDARRGRRNAMTGFQPEWTSTIATAPVQRGRKGKDKEKSPDEATTASLVPAVPAVPASSGAGRVPATGRAIPVVPGPSGVLGELTDPDAPDPSTSISIEDPTAQIAPTKSAQRRRRT